MKVKYKLSAHNTKTKTNYVIISTLFTDYIKEKILNKVLPKNWLKKHG